MTPPVTTTDVVIVGAGPTGLVVACLLAERGVPFLLVDQLAEGANTSRAAAIHPRTLEVLERLQVTPRLLAAGHQVPRFEMHDRDRVLATIPFDSLPSCYRYTLMVPQHITEQILLARLRELGGDVTRPYSAVHVRQYSDRAVVTLEDRDHCQYSVNAKYVVGADGMHSAVREHAGIGFVGAPYEQSFVLADVRLHWADKREAVMLFLSPEGLMVVAPLPDDRYRIVATFDDPPVRPEREHIQDLLDTRGPLDDPALVLDVLWTTRFRVHHRLAERYRKGRVLLAGDAAHVHSPAGGQGMNTGIQDAIALGDALMSAIAHPAGEGLLDLYEQHRRPVAERVVSFTDRMTRIATMRGAAKQAARNTLIGLAGRIPAVPRRLALELSGVANAQWSAA